MRKKIGRRRKLFWWVINKGGVPEDNILPKWAKCLRFLLFPIETTHYMYIDKNSIYDSQRDSFRIFGVDYSRQFFQNFVQEKPFLKVYLEIVQREDAYVTIRQHVPVQTLDELILSMEACIKEYKGFTGFDPNEISSMKWLLEHLNRKYIMLERSI